QAAADVFLLGGRFSPADQMVTGPLTENTLSTFTFNRCFIGCMGLDLAKKAVYVTDMECLALKKMAMRNSEKTYLLLDASKENKKGPFRLAEYTEFDVVYVNKGEHRKKYPDNFIVV
ncbi:MAG: DeoR/GlpR transcriptional regulator, partial [Parasporobacterium sp.]|nr:DeoR/GlpR transcriptional regulator [Parasporobacterium sp.]